MFRLAVGLLVAALSATAVLSISSFTPPPASPKAAEGCEWEWAGPVTGWVLVDKNCPTGHSCTKPGFNGQFTGQVAFQPCQPNPGGGSGKVSDCGCGQ